MKLNSNNIDDIVFQNRNKNYGAFELRKNYTKRGVFALIITVFTVWLFSYSFFIYSQIVDQAQYDSDVYFMSTEISKMEDIKPDVVIPPTLKYIPPKIEEIKFTPPVIVDEILPDEREIKSNEEIIDTLKIITPEEIGDIFEEDDTETGTFFSAEEMPEFPGGQMALIKWISERIVYPTDSKGNMPQGKVYVQFEVTKNGEVDKVTVVSGADPLLDNEAVRVVSMIKGFKPGRQRGKPVGVWYTVPINFRIN